MFTLTFRYSDPDLTAALLKATSHLVTRDAVELMELQNLPEEPEQAGEVEPFDPQLVEKIVAAIRPRPGQAIRVEVISHVLTGGDTLHITAGEPDHSFRAATSGLSRSLRPVFPYLASPIDMLVSRTRTYFPDGSYEGVTYTPTSLGHRVYKVLKSEGALEA